MPARAGNSQRPPFGGNGNQRGADGKPLIRVVRPHLHADLTAEAVRPSDPANDELH